MSLTRSSTCKFVSLYCQFTMGNKGLGEKINQAEEIDTCASTMTRRELRLQESMTGIGDSNDQTRDSRIPDTCQSNHFSE